MSQGSLNTKIMFLHQNFLLCSLSTDRQTHRHENKNRRHPYRVQGVFPSTSSSRSSPTLHILISQTPPLRFLKDKIGCLHLVCMLKLFHEVLTRMSTMLSNDPQDHQVSHIKQNWKMSTNQFKRHHINIFICIQMPRL